MFQISAAAVAKNLHSPSCFGLPRTLSVRLPPSLPMRGKDHLPISRLHATSKEKKEREREREGRIKKWAYVSLPLLVARSISVGPAYQHSPGGENKMRDFKRDGIALIKVIGKFLH